MDHTSEMDHTAEMGEHTHAHYCTINCRLSMKAKINLYLNEFNPKSNGRFVENAMFCDAFDLYHAKCICSIGHNQFNEYMFGLENQTFIDDTQKRLIPNDKSTSKKILFYVVFDKLPNKVTFDHEFEYGLDEKAANEIIEKIKSVSVEYPNATVDVVSNVFQFYTHEANMDDKLIKKINELSSDRINLKTGLKLNEIDSNEYALIATNKITYLFTISVDKQIPLVILDANVFDETYLKKFYNRITDSDFVMYNNYSEFDSFLCSCECNDESFDKLCRMFMKMKQDYAYMSGSFFSEENVPVESITKLCLYDKANIYKPFFATEENKKLVSFMYDVRDKEALVVTVMHHKFEQHVSDQTRWLGLDSDNFVHSNAEKKSLRYYHQSYNNIKPIYHFNSVDEIATKFGLGSVRDMRINEAGVIWIFLDNPFGRNYDKPEVWVEKWRAVMTKIVNMNLPNKIYVRPYSNEDRVHAMYYGHFGDYKTYAVYDKESATMDILDVMDTENVYFCVKRQGPWFGKCFVRGKLLLSALSENEAKTKTDYLLLKQYEHKLDALTSTNIKTKLRDISNTYLVNKFDTLKLITSYLVAIEDVKNGTFLKALLHK